MIDKSTLRATLNNLVQRGWYLFPLKPKSKFPAIRDYLSEASKDINVLMRWADKFGTTNFGLSLAKSGLVAVDVDEGGLEHWDALCFHHGEPETLKIRSGSGVGAHYIFKAKKSIRYRGKIVKGIDVKHNGFVVVPGSVHPRTGKLYRFVKDQNPAQNPAWLGDLIEKKDLAQERPVKDYKFAGDAYYRKIIDQLKEKEFDHDDWVRLGMSLHAAFEGSEDGLSLFLELSRGVNYQDGDDDLAIRKWESFSNRSGNVSAGTFVYMAKQLGCEIPSPNFESDKKVFGKVELPDGYIEDKKGRKKSQFEKAEDQDLAEDSDLLPFPEWTENSYGHKITTDAAFLVEQINKLGFAMLSGAQEGKIIKHWKDKNGAQQFKMLGGEDFKNALANYSYRFRNPDTGRKQNVAAAQVWLKSSKKKTFKNIVFRPQADKDDLNLWADIPCKEVKGDVSQVLDLIHILSGENKKKADYFIKWLAHMIQRPWEKCVVVPVLIGEQGTGKGIFTDQILRRILGHTYIRLDKPGVIKERFNMEQSKKFLTVLDEASWRGDHELSNIMKSLTGNDTMTVEEKFGGRITIENFSRYAVTSNDAEAVRVEVSNRRYFVMEVSTRWKNTDRFSRIARSIRKDKLPEKFFSYLKTVSLEDFDPFKFPELLDTGASATKIRGLGIVGEFWNQVLIEDPQPILQFARGNTFLCRNNVYELFVDFSDKVKHYQKGITPHVFWRDTASIIPVLDSKHQTRPRVGTVKLRGYNVKPHDLLESFCLRSRIPMPTDIDDLEYIAEKEFDSVEGE